MSGWVHCRCGQSCAHYPAVQAVEALAVAVPLFLLLLAAGYSLMSSASPGAFSEPLDRTDAIYVTVAVFATVGFGDIVLVTESARVVVTLQMVGDLLVLGVLLQAILGAVKLGRARRRHARRTDHLTHYGWRPTRSVRRRSARQTRDAARTSAGKETDVATLTVWKFDDAGAAEKAVATLESLAKQQMINLEDAATVSWPAGAKKPKTRQLRSMTAAGALGGSFWGLLFGLIFFVPLLGLAVGAAMGALGGSMSDVGIDDDFIKRARNEITPGTSALFLMSSDAVIDKVRDAFSGQRAELVSTNLSNDQERNLREVFSESE